MLKYSSTSKKYIGGLLLLIFILAGTSLYLVNQDVVRQQSEVTVQETDTSASLPQQLEVSSANCDLDVELVVDVSPSMMEIAPDGRRDIDWATDAMNAFVARMRHYATNTDNNIRVGLTQFSMHGGNDAAVLQTLTNNYDLVSQAMVGLAHNSEIGGTCMIRGLGLANNDMISNEVPDNKKIQIVFSDGCGNMDSYANYISVRTSRELSLMEADFGRSHGITYYVVGYGTQQITGYHCREENFDAQTLLGLAGDPLRYHHRPNVEQWATTFEQIAAQICETPQISCHVSSSVNSSVTNPLVLNSGDTVTVGTNFDTVFPEGKSAQVRYSIFDSSIASITSTSTVDVPNPSGSTSLSYYYSDVDIVPNSTASTGARTMLRADVYMDNILSCSTTTFLRVDAEPAWWQTGLGDVIAANGPTVSNLPTSGATLFFTSPHLGIPFYKGNITPSATANIGNPGWKVNSTYRGYRTPQGDNYDYDYFSQRFRPDKNINQAGINTAFFDSNTGFEKDGYRMFYTDVSLGLQGIDLRNGRSDKIVVFVGNYLNIFDKVRIDKGQDFLMFIVKNKIMVLNGVGDTSYLSSLYEEGVDIEGVFVTDREFITDSSTTEPRQLIVRGMVVGWGINGVENGISFTRDLELGNNSYPAEVFIYAPDMLLNFPSVYAEKSMTWQEVAP